MIGIGIGVTQQRRSSGAPSFAAGDWTLDASPTSGQALLTINTVPSGADAIEYTTDDGTTVHRLWDASTGARHIPSLTPATDVSMMIRPDGGEWSAPKSASLPAVKGLTPATLSIAPSFHYHAGTGTTLTSGRVTALADQQGAAPLTSVEANAPTLLVDEMGRQFMRPVSNESTIGLRSLDTLPIDVGRFTAFAVGRNSGIGARVVVTGTGDGGSTYIFLGCSRLGGNDEPTRVTVNNNQGPDDAGEAQTVGQQLGLIGSVFRHTSSAVARWYVNGGTGTRSRSVNAAARTGFGLGGGGFDLYELVIYSREVPDAEAEIISADLMAHWGFVEPEHNMILHGDSITAGAGVPSAFDRLGQVVARANLIPANWRVSNMATSGSTIADITTRRDVATNWPTSTFKAGGRNIVVLQIARNDFSQDIEAIKTNYAAYLNTPTTGILQRGWEVMIAANIGDSTSTVQVKMEALRTWLESADFLAAVQAGPGQEFEGRVQVRRVYLAEDAGLTPLRAPTTSVNAYYADGVHPTGLGTSIMGTGGEAPQHGLAYDIV